MSWLRLIPCLALLLPLSAALLPLGAVAGEAPAFDTPPRIVKLVNPIYPERARKAGAEGKILVQLQLDAAGAVTDSEVVGEVTGWPEFTAAALAVLPEWRFEAARLDGDAVPAEVLVPLNFRLDPGKGERPALSKVR